MAKTLSQIFLDHGQPSPDWDEAKKAAFKKDMDEYDADVRKAVPLKPPTPDPDPKNPVAKIDPALQQTIDELKSTISTIGEALKGVTTYVKSTEAEKAAAAKSSAEDRYKKHVQKLADEGRITKEAFDTYMKPEEMAKNIGSIEMFESLTSQLPVNPAFKGVPKQQSQQQQQQQQVTEGGKSMDQLRAEAEAAFEQMAAGNQPGRL